MDLIKADFQISEISDTELEKALKKVIADHKNVVNSIKNSMDDASAVYKKYLEPDFMPDEKQAKDDRAELNKAEKDIADQFATLKKAYEKPLSGIELNITEIRKAIKGASETVDKKVKDYEEIRKTKKKQEITDYFKIKKFELLPIERIWNERWLNKTFEMRDIEIEMDGIIKGIYNEIQVLERIPDYGMTAKALYLETLDMSQALLKVDQLKENAEKLAKEEMNRESRKQCETNWSSEKREVGELTKKEIINSKIDKANDLPLGTTTAQQKEEILEYTMTIKGTSDQLLKLRQYMTSIGIPYQKGLLFENENQAKKIKEKKEISGKIYSFLYVA